MNNQLAAYLWGFLIPGYLFTVAIETPVLIVGLSRPHPLRHRIAAGIWLNACSYPIVVLTLPSLMGLDSRWYLWVAEIFAPVIECALFAAAYHTPALTRANRIQDMITVILANLASFLLGLWFTSHGWLTGWGANG
jgi:hypothetical protein